MLFCRVGLDVSRDLARVVDRLPAAHRIHLGTHRGRRAVGCFAQAVLLPRIMRQRATVADPARDNDILLETA